MFHGRFPKSFPKSLLVPSLLWLMSAIVIADCSQKLCVEVRYAGNYEPGVPPFNCIEWQTDGADALLAANTEAELIRTTQQQVGGTRTAHPTIKVRWRSWSACTTECYSTVIWYSEATVTGTAGAWSLYTTSQYCKTGGT